ncbi:very short patch repair endonuclease [Geminisphaera colitermitum]|uniref:very short patch repair endonuclease n=1 Tax=Geminisphaera colitermitum TaxID=1148786 RepID=UPI000158C571|nr:very short patch repair endonuclease [Geminisphaera colitermitum]
MSDVFTKAKRSAVMARIRGSGNKDTELRLIAIFRENGITGWRRKQTVLGKPDFVFRKPHSGMKRLAVFVDGCFWHGCPLHGTQPKNNAEFWLAKIARNQTRDQLVTRTLRARGWRVLRIWEHELARKNRARLLARLRRTGII